MFAQVIFHGCIIRRERQRTHKRQSNRSDEEAAFISSFKAAGTIGKTAVALRQNNHFFTCPIIGLHADKDFGNFLAIGANILYRRSSCTAGNQR